MCARGGAFLHQGQAVRWSAQPGPRGVTLGDVALRRPTTFMDSGALLALPGCPDGIPSTVTVPV